MDGAPLLRTGLGLRSPLAPELEARRPPLGFLEVHAENLMADAPARESTARLAETYPLSLHGVGLSLAGPDHPCPEHLGRFAALIAQFEPVLISEHLAWSGTGGRFHNDLLPLPYTEETLSHAVENIAIAQEALGRRLLIENPSTYLTYALSTIPEPDFLAELVRRTGCGVLVDVNNIAVSAFNHGWDAAAYLEALPAQAVGELHLAGHVEEDTGGEILRIDTHDRPVSAEVWSLYREALRRFGPVPTLIEWDKDLPALDVLLAEVARADAVAADVSGGRAHALA